MENCQIAFNEHSVFQFLGNIYVNEELQNLILMNIHAFNFIFKWRIASSHSNEPPFFYILRNIYGNRELPHLILFLRFLINIFVNHILF